MESRIKIGRIPESDYAAAEIRSRTHGNEKRETMERIKMKMKRQERKKRDGNEG